MGGDLLATATHGNPNDKLVGAIAVNLWSSYAKNSEDLNFVLVDCEVNVVQVDFDIKGWEVCNCKTYQISVVLLWGQHIRSRNVEAEGILTISFTNLRTKG